MLGGTNWVTDTMSKPQFSFLVAYYLSCKYTFAAEEMLNFWFENNRQEPSCIDQIYHAKSVV